jgi:hypothetical protein
MMERSHKAAYHFCVAGIVVRKPLTALTRCAKSVEKFSPHSLLLNDIDRCNYVHKI